MSGQVGEGRRGSPDSTRGHRGTTNNGTDTSDTTGTSCIGGHGRPSDGSTGNGSVRVTPGSRDTGNGV